MDLLSLQLMVRVAERGAIAAAARDLGLSAASASARLNRLEQGLEFQVFTRSTRAVSLTEDGQTFLPFARRTIEAIEAGMGEVSRRGAPPKGTVRLTLPGSLGRMHIVPALADFQKQHPQLGLDLRLSDELLDVVEGGYDVIIRNAGPTPQTSLEARRLADDARILVAAPEYLERAGTPQSPADLSHHSWVNLYGKNRLNFADGQSVQTPRGYTVNDGAAMRAMIEAGLGLGLKSMWNAQASRTAGRLVRVENQDA
mgnify:CR=1 FL=1